MVKKIIATTLCALMLIAMPGKTTVIRAELHPVSSKPEIVRNAGVYEKEDAWHSFTEYINLGEIENDGIRDQRGTEGADSEEPGADISGSAGDDEGGSLQGLCDEVYQDDIASDPGSPEGTGEAAAEAGSDTETAKEILTYAGEWTVTFYDLCPECCGRWYGMNTTASGNPPIAWWTVAAGLSIPFGTLIYIEGFGTFEVMDRGVGDGCVDILVNDHSEIPSYGVTTAAAYIVG